MKKINDDLFGYSVCYTPIDNDEYNIKHKLYFESNEIDKEDIIELYFNDDKDCTDFDGCMVLPIFVATACIGLGYSLDVNACCGDNSVYALISYINERINYD